MNRTILSTNLISNASLQIGIVLYNIIDLYGQIQITNIYMGFDIQKIWQNFIKDELKTETSSKAFLEILHFGRFHGDIKY